MVTAKQQAALKYLIYRAKDGTELSKRILTFLVGESSDFTKEVCLTLLEDRDGYTIEEIHNAALGLSAMQSSNGTTHLNQILHTMGSELCFSLHYGDYDPRRPDPFNTDGQFVGWPEDKVVDLGLVKKGMPMRYTFWLANDNYSRSAHLLVANRDELEKITLAKPGLYPILESV
jgi:hypothetical protein